ncbi:hypothetical protein ACFV4P_19045 [Kitasatospora sp. NPDC059795]|uniref:hypothetical protein n=1 Tax=Kitasatospora sp. NPDC059795 TaxID=3346949 RepID=UPI00365DCCDB
MPELDGGRKRLVLAMCCASMVMAVLDITVVNVALPSAQWELGASVEALPWTVDTYTPVPAGVTLCAPAPGPGTPVSAARQTGSAVAVAGTALAGGAAFTSAAHGVRWRRAR